jgi:phage gp29-like protein
MAEYLPATTTPSRPPALVDHQGRPLRAEQMTIEVAGPTTSGVRSIVSGHPAQGLTPERLGSLLHAAEQGNATAYLELAEEMEEKDLHYLSVLGTRKRAISQLPIEVDAASDDPEAEADAQLIRDWLKRDTLEIELFDILDAIGKGYSAIEIVWEFTAKAWLPCRLKWRDPRWFEFDRVDGETLMMKGLGGPEPLPGFKFIAHVHPAKSGLPIRSGIARAVAWSYLFKNYAIKDWVTFLDAYGMPLRVGKYENGTTEDNIRLLMRALSMLGSDAAAAFPKSMDVEFVDRKGGETGDLFERLATWADLQVSKAVLGQTSTTDAVAGGLGSGQATTHNDVRGDIERADAKLLSATLNRDLVQPIVMLNRGQREAYPKIRIGRPEEEDVKAFLEGVDAAVKYGVPVGVSTFRQKTGIAEPAEGEERLAAPKPPPAEKTPGSGAAAVEAPSGAGDGPDALLDPLTAADGGNNG